MNRILLTSLILITTLRAFGQQTKTQIDYFGLITAATDYKTKVSDSYHLTRSWVFIDKKTDTPDKLRLKEFCQTAGTRLNEMLSVYAYLLDSADITTFIKVKENVGTLIEKQTYIISSLKTFESYDDPLIVFDVLPPVESGGAVEELINGIIADLDKLIQKKTQEYVELLGRQDTHPSSVETAKTKKIKQLLNLLNVSAQIKDMLTVSNKSGLSRNYLEKDIYTIFLQKYDKYYTESEIDDLIAFYKTKTGKRVVKVSKQMMVEALTEIVNSIN